MACLFAILREHNHFLKPFSLHSCFDPANYVAYQLTCETTHFFLAYFERHEPLLISSIFLAANCSAGSAYSVAQGECVNCPIGQYRPAGINPPVSGKGELLF